MNKLALKTTTLFLLLCTSIFHFHASLAHEYHVKPGWLQPPEGIAHIGDSHGEITVAGNGEVYVSVMGELGGIQVYSAEGNYLRNVPNAPKDIHGFVIKVANDGKEYIYGAEMNNSRVFKLSLTGERILDIDALKLIPAKYHRSQIKEQNWPTPKLRLTAVDVDSEGSLYVVDGYGLDYIHKFSPGGQYLSTFAGRDAPWRFNNCHKIAIDPRYQPNRILCADRANHRLVHLQLNGDLIGNFAKDLRRPSAVDFYQDYVAVAEITGRVTILDKQGQVIKHLGINEVPDEVNGNKTPPEKWREGVFTSPHGISYDAKGNLYITEYNKWGRVLRFDAVTQLK